MDTKVCSKCGEEKELTEFYKTKGRYVAQCKSCIKIRSDKYYQEKREAKLIYQKNYAEKNKESIQEYLKEYRIKNIDKLRKTAVEYELKRGKRDPEYKLRRSLKHRIYVMFQNKTLRKSKPTLELLGTDIKSAKEHLESTFQEGMSWDNHGEWHIDHIIPLSSARNKKEMEMLCHYTNLQALWAIDNISKGGNFKEEDLNNFLNSLTKDD